MNFERLCIGCMREKKENEKMCPYCGCDEEAYVVPKQALQPFTILNGKYLLGRVLGIGGFGIAYIAVDIPLERRIAIKEFFPAGNAYREEETTVTLGGISEAQKKMVGVTREKFAAEARMLAQLEAMDGIVKVYDFFEENRTAYIVMEYLDGITLKDYVKRKTKLSWKETLTKIRPVLHSLEILHENGILHRDISPDNIMVLKDESLKLFDFGGAKDQAAQQGVSVVAFKKAGYSPIEQYQVDGELGAWSDEYALAATMYYCICGHAPAEASSRMLDSANFKTPHQEGAELPKEAEKVLLKGMAIKAADRYPSLKKFEAALYETKRLDQDWIKKAAVIGISVLVVAGVGACAGHLVSGNKTMNSVENKEENKTEATKKNKEGNVDDLKEKTEKQTETETEEQKTTYSITVTGGSGSGEYANGDKVVVKAEDRTSEGCLFVGWEIISGSVKIENSYSEVTNVVVQGEDATLEAVYFNEIEDSISEGKKSAQQGEYGAAIEWYQQAARKGSTEAQELLDDLTASLKEKEKYKHKITVVNGSGTGIYTEWKEVTIKAKNRSQEGYEFVAWEVTEGTVEIKDSSAAETTIVVPDQEATIEAVYQEIAETETEKETEKRPETEEQKTIEELSSDGYESYWNEDYEEAVKNFQEAADRGDADAQEMLAICYEYGRGVAQDDEQATMWYQKAAEQYQKAAEEGDAEAEYDIGRLYMFGEGVEQDSAKAVEWFQKAADQGHELAPYYLANCYLYGDGVEKNTEKAAEWLEKLAVEGWSDSQYMLGKLYIEGDGVEKNKEKGKAWLQKAADQGYEDAQKLLNSLAGSE